MRKLTASGAAIGAFFLLSAPGAAGGGLILAPALALAGAIAAPWTRLAAGARRYGPAIAPLLLFSAWAAASACWSRARTAPAEAGKVIALTLLGVLFVAGAAQPRAKAQIRGAALIAVAILVALLAIEALGDMPINRLFQPHAETGVLMRNPAKGAAILVALLAPSLAALPRAGRWRWLAGALLAGATLALSAQFAMDADVVACLGALAAFGLAQLAPRLVATASLWAAGGWLAIAPWAYGALAAVPILRERAPLSWRQRTEIWDFATARIFERPWFGHGLDCSRTFANETRFAGMDVRALPLHPHSFSLNVWLDSGAIGAGLGALALFVGGWFAGRAVRSRADAGAIAGAAAALGFIWNVSFGAWQEWWIAAAFASAGLIAAARRNQTP